MKRRGNYSFLSKFSHYTPGVGGMLALLAWMGVGALLSGIVMLVLNMAMGQQLAAEYFNLISYPIMFIPPMLYASSKSARESMVHGGAKLDNNHFAPVGAVLCVVLAIAGTLALGFWSEYLVALLPPMPEVLKTALEQLTAGNVWINFITVSIFAPLFEEWLCRGMVLRGLLVSTKIKPFWAIVISALFFALIHLNPWQAIPAFLMGCLFGWVYYRTGSLKLTMLMHFTNNSFALVLGHIDSLKDMESWAEVMPAQPYYICLAACFLLTVLVTLSFGKIKPASSRGNCDEVPSLFDSQDI